MSRQAVISIAPGGGDNYSVELFERDGDTLRCLVPAKVIQLAEAELDSLNQLLPGNNPPAALQPDGEKLCNKLRQALGQEFDDLLNGDTARIYLDLHHGAPELHHIPWELMVWAKPGPFGPIPTWLSRKHHLCRIAAENWQQKPEEAQGPLRLLIVIGQTSNSNAAGVDEIGAGQEESEIRRQVRSADRTIDLDTIQPASKDELYGKINDFVPHVLHFIGHGTSGNKQKQEPPALKFRSWDWTAIEVSTDVAGPTLNQWQPCLVFLNACRTGNASGQTAPMVGAFLANGAKAAVAMQGNIKGGDAGKMAGIFYGKLAAGIPINEALTIARTSLPDDKQAAFPALTLRCAPEAILPCFQPADVAYKQGLATCELRLTLQVFVNQLKPRRRLYGSFWPYRPQDLQRPRTPFVLLRGKSGFGKSLLSVWMLDLSIRIGHRVRYVKVASKDGGVDHIEILKLIWGVSGVNARSPLTDPLPGWTPELAAQLDRAKETKDTAVYASFRSKLAEISTKQPLTIVLDDFLPAMDRGSFWKLWENLFVPLANKEIKNVNLILVLGEDEYTQYEIEKELTHSPHLKVPTDVISLEELGKQEFVQRFIEYLHIRDPRFEQVEKYRMLGDALTPIFTENEEKPLTVARLEQKYEEIARACSLPHKELRERLHELIN